MPGEPRHPYMFKSCTIHPTPVPLSCCANWQSIAHPLEQSHKRIPFRFLVGLSSISRAILQLLNKHNKARRDHHDILTFENAARIWTCRSFLRHLFFATSLEQEIHFLPASSPSFCKGEDCEGWKFAFNNVFWLLFAWAEGIKKGHDIQMECFEWSWNEIFASFVKPNVNVSIQLLFVRPKVPLLIWLLDMK